MASTFQITVFGKPGCQKCRVLHGRLDKLLSEESYADMEMRYCDLETEEGLVEFCEAECLNPSGVPAMLVKRRDEESGRYHCVPANPSTRAAEVCGRSHLSIHSGLQTDYSAEGKGVISGRMIEAVLREARGEES